VKLAENTLLKHETIRLAGAHGEDVVRSIYMDEAGAIYTAGEDGQVKAWRAATSTNLKRKASTDITPASQS
jgi:hypothetical protein